jgi:hypothetical protein
VEKLSATVRPPFLLFFLLPYPPLLAAGNAVEILAKLEDLASSIDHHKLPYKLPELRDLFYRGAAIVIKSPEVRLLPTFHSFSSTHPLSQPDFTILQHVVTLPIRLFTEASIAVGQEVWTWLADARPELEPRVVAEVLEAWAGTVEKEQGLFSTALEYVSFLSSILVSFSTFVECRTEPKTSIAQSREPPRPEDRVHPHRQIRPHSRLPPRQPSFFADARTARLPLESLPGFPIQERRARRGQYEVGREEFGGE